ncbi:polyketide synthase [Mycobacterium asiaticum]|uniref:Polyketide synthase n=1 Tax=Mycobacterium asiaticum TaxID=1790 RepID=A0A1A3PGH3_MYCAS|nr:type I polyketide synthase [Mycobacterium asiaticum]OBK31697.1 polyketide synthase [Mycobacterium asiaticum]
MQPTDIAVIGLACRFPAANNPAEFWQLLRDGREVTDPLAKVGDFDADFFRLSPREAAAMDPRQRLGLELTWELFENAFIVPETVRGEEVAVYLGAMNDDYTLLTVRDATHDLDQHAFAGLSRGMIANRISYVYGIHGPSLVIDCGQSSSLVAVHLACESLRNGTSTMAIAGGIHLNLAHETALLETEFGAVSPSGRTYAFDERADGYVRSEGAGLVLLKPLQAALRDENRIHAVISGGAVGNAGHTAAGLTVPSVSSQADVVRRAMSDAGVDRDQVDYIEAHGTGTEVGDPLEASALGEIFGERKDRPVAIGSVKTNIGHTGAAAGVAGLIKTVLAVEHAWIPASLNFERGAVDLDALGLLVNTTLTPWDAKFRRAAVSSFGMGGTNAHVIVEQAPVTSTCDDDGTEPSETVSVPWVLTARSAAALARQARRLAENVDELEIADVGWSLATTRSVFEHRAVLIGADRARLVDGLAGLAAGESAALVGRAHPPGLKVFVFPGQGAQYLGMGSQLYGRFAAFARAFDEVVEVLAPHLRLPLPQVIWGTDAALLQSTEFAQPALFAVELALVALLRSWGVVPDVVLGHSVGEIAAAQVAGVLSLQQAAQLVVARGRLMAELPPGGVMVAVAASEAEVTPLLSDEVGLAAVNAPDAVVLSGSAAAVGAAVDGLAGGGRRVHRLAVSHAFHSASMEPMLADFADALSGLNFFEPRIRLLSNVTGQLAGAGYGSAHYWVEHARKTVRFADSVQTVRNLGAATFVEVGPGAGLVADQESSIATLAENRPEPDALLAAAGRLFIEGTSIDWAATFDGVNVRKVELPTYAFVRQRFWLGASADSSGPGPDEALNVARLQDLDPEQQHRRLVELVCFHAAIVLGHAGRQDIDAERAFGDLGFNSMTGVELRNRLKADRGLAGLSLSRTLIFDYPTPAALADYLAQQLTRGPQKESDDDRIWSLLHTIPISELRRTGLLEKLLLLAGQSEKPTSEPSLSEDVIDSLSTDALIAMTLSRDDENGPGTN